MNLNLVARSIKVLYQNDEVDGADANVERENLSLLQLSYLAGKITLDDRVFFKHVTLLVANLLFPESACSMNGYPFLQFFKPVGAAKANHFTGLRVIQALGIAEAPISDRVKDNF